MPKQLSLRATFVLRSRQCNFPNYFKWLTWLRMSNSVPAKNNHLDSFRFNQLNDPFNLWMGFCTWPLCLVALFFLSFVCVPKISGRLSLLQLLELHQMAYIPHIFNVLLKPFVFYFAHLNGTMRPFGNGYWLHFRRIFSRRVANHIKTLLFLRASFISIFCVCVSVGYNFFRHIWRCCCWLGSGARFPNVAVFNLFVHAKQQLLSEFSLLFLALSLSIASLALSLNGNGFSGLMVCLANVRLYGFNVSLRLVISTFFSLVSSFYYSKQNQTKPEREKMLNANQSAAQWFQV